VCTARDISATLISMGVKVFLMVELCPGTRFSASGSDTLFGGHQMRGQESGSGGPFSASQTPIFLSFDRECLENGKPERYMSIRA